MEVYPQSVATPSASAPRALLLVRNGVKHDARVLRAARVLQAEGYAVLIAGVETVEAPAGRFELDGIAVVRVPGSLRGAGRRPTSAASASATAVRDGPPPPAAALGWSAKAAARRTVRAAAFAWGTLRVARTWRPDLVHANDHNTMWTALPSAG